MSATTPTLRSPKQRANAGVMLRTAAGEPVEVLARASRADEVAAIVLGAPDVAHATPLAHSTALQLITVLEKPAVLVPRKAAAGQVGD